MVQVNFITEDWMLKFKYLYNVNIMFTNKVNHRSFWGGKCKDWGTSVKSLIPQQVKRSAWWVLYIYYVYKKPKRIVLSDQKEFNVLGKVVFIKAFLYL